MFLMARSDSLGMEEEGMRGVWCLMAILRQVGSQDTGFILRYSVQKPGQGQWGEGPYLEALASGAKGAI